MSAMYRWVERLKDRDAICSAILALAAATQTSVLTHPPELFEEDLEDRSVRDARIQLALLIEDPALTMAINHALKILCKRWQVQESPVRYASPPAPVSRSIFQKLRRHLWHTANQKESRDTYCS